MLALSPGAIDAVLGFLACAAPRMTFMIYGIIPVPAWLAVGGFFAYDVYGTAMDNVRRGHRPCLV